MKFAAKILWLRERPTQLVALDTGALDPVAGPLNGDDLWRFEIHLKDGVE